MPQGVLNKVLYILLFPIHLILWILPNYHKDPNVKKLAFSFICNLFLLTALLFCIEWWMHEIGKGINLPIEILGNIFIAAGISGHFLQYNYNFAKKTKENVDFF